MSHAKPLADFLAAAHLIHGSGAGTQETSFYTPLNNLLDTLGAVLKPKVRCLMQLNNQGGGMPDGGLFTQDQFDRNTGEVKDKTLPARGAIEVKSPKQAVESIADSDQVIGYVNRYHLVLVTNLRDWLLIGERDGRPARLEAYTLAKTEAEFWGLAAHPDKAEKAQGQPFADFLRRAMTHAAPLADPKDLAWLLASYAREARHRVEHASAAAEMQLEALKLSLENALGVSFDSHQGEHFFRSTLVQTLFYGVFAAWVLRHQSHSDHAPSSQQGRAFFDWRTAAYDLHVPMILALFEQLSQPTKLKSLNLIDVLDWSADALNRVDREAFFQRFEAEDSVQYFYEPFLEAFDPELRKQLGVWYTPKEIVRYQVARVDWALRNELGLPDGLADPKVVVLDPCCGTGAYLVEVLRVIAGHWRGQGGGALAGHELKRAALTRLFGFELLPAPYVVAHLQLGLLLHRLKVPLKTLTDGSDERVGVYLTNALTGWEPPKEPKNLVLPFPEFAAEREAANHVKRTEKILVILGNPPYNGYAGVAMDEERGLSDAYRKAEQGPKPQGQGLNDLYVRFFRMAERQIAECTGQGVVCYISNYSWLDGLSHTAMREQFLQVFDRVWIDNLHGNRIISEYAPDGRSSETIFAIQGSSPGIKVGTAIALLVRRPQREDPEPRIEYADFAQARADERREALLHSLDSPPRYHKVMPDVRLGHPFKPSATTEDYFNWPKLPDLFPVSYPGIKTSRDAALVEIDRDVLEKRMRRYFDPQISDADIAAESPELMEKTSGFEPSATRKALLIKGFASGRIVRYCYRPFDNRWLYWHPDTKLLDRNRLDYMSQIFEENVWLFTTGQTRKGIPEPAYLTSPPADLNLQDSGARGIPLLIRESFQDLLGDHSADRPNLSKLALDYLAGLSHLSPAPTRDNIAPRDNIALSDVIPEDLFFHALAVLHSPAYRDANGGALRQDWPRIPLPRQAAVLQSSANWGRAVAALLDTETSVQGITVFSGAGAHPSAFSINGAVVAKLALPVKASLDTPSLNSTVSRAAMGLNTIAVFTRSDGEGAEDVDFELTAGWGHGGKDGVTMPGRGRVESRLAEPGEVDRQWGEKTLDVYLNGRAYWKNIPQPVWEYTLGGYQVLKKWLSYREKSLLGRALKLDEIKEFAAIARRIAALSLLRESLDANYSAVISQTSDRMET